MDRITKQLNFLKEIDKIKGIFRASLILDGSKRENDAEHSWHMGIVAITLSEYYEKEISMEKVLKLILVHDIVEIYAGDFPCFGESVSNKYELELESAYKIFSLLPSDQMEFFLELWKEFEEQKTNEAIFANCCDRYQGFLQNLMSDGHTWRLYNVSLEQILKRIKPLKDNIPLVYEKMMLPEIEKYIEKGAINR